MKTDLPIPRRRLPALLALCCLPFGAAAPAHASDQATELGNIVVTAASREQALKDAPASITVVTREALEQRPLNDLSNVLGGVEGVTLSRSGNGVPTVQLRGLGSAYTLILVDGKRVNSTNAVFRGNDYDLGWVPVADIERIEVVRGPMSSLYGSDAIGGVINIITRKVGKTWTGSLKQEFTLQDDREAGDAMSTNLSVRGPLVADTLGLALSGGYDKRDADGNVNSSGQTGMPRRENRYGSAKLNWTPDRNNEITTGYDYALRDHDHFLLKRDVFSIGHKGRYSFGSSEVNFQADETRNKTGTTSGEINPNKANSEILDGKLVLPLEALLSQIVTVGGDFRRERLNDPKLLSGVAGQPGYGSEPEISVRQHAFFVEDELELRDNLRLTLGNRYDHHQNFGGNNSPRSYLIYHALPGLSFKGGIARAFRAPTLLQNSPQWGSVSCGSATTGCYIIGSTDLEPETSTSRELGMQATLGEWQAAVTGFHTDLKNMIDITSRTSNRTLAPSYSNFVGFLSDGRPIFAYQNIARVRSRGVESSLNGKLTQQIALHATYTYTDAKNLSGSTPLPMINRSVHVANLGADWQLGAKWKLSGNARYNGRQYLTAPTASSAGLTRPDYTVFDLSAAWQASERLALRGGVLNIGNSGVERSNSSDFNEEGRRYFVSATASF